MKLLDKTTLQSARQNEQKMEIDQAVMLTERITKLRNVAVEEELELDKLRTLTKRQVMEEIDCLKRDKDFLKRELKDLTDKKVKLQEPLDKEWEELNQEKVQIQGTKEYLNKLIRENEKESRLIQERLNQATKLLYEYQERQKFSEKTLQKVISQVENKRLELSELEITVDNFEKRHEAQVKNFVIRENKLIEQEKSLASRQKQVNAKEKALNKLAIRYEQLH